MSTEQADQLVAGTDPASVFRRRARAHPDRPALCLPGRTLSYAELADCCLDWAGRLTELAGGRPRRVGVLARREESAYVGILAALTAGAAFVPLSPMWPANRLSAAIAAADLDVLLVSAQLLPTVIELGRRVRLPVVFVADGPLAGHHDELPAGSRGSEGRTAGAAPGDFPVPGPEDLAYLMFTSGTTGRPKCIGISHTNLRSFLDHCHARYRLSPQDRLSQTFELVFDLSVFDMFMAWESGASLHPASAIDLLAPPAFVRERELTVWFSVPSAVQSLRRGEQLRITAMPTLRWSLFCGERLPRRTAESWQAAAPESILDNLYGPTELTVACSVYRWDPARSPAECVDEVVPIGRLFNGLTARIEPLERGGGPDHGELWVAGPQLTPGYWRDPALDATRFVSVGAATGESVRYYRTGDLVESRNGLLVHHGRIDDQVKLRGFRIELAEIEGALLDAGAAEAAVFGLPCNAAPDSLVAVVTAAGPGMLRGRMEQVLPGYMIPRRILELEHLPRGVNGKVDRAALRALIRAESSDDRG